MHNKNAKFFSMGHAVIAFVLVLLYLQVPNQPSVLLLALCSLLWTYYLIWRAYFRKDLIHSLQRASVWLYIMVDTVLLAFVFAVPDWSGTPFKPTWILLFVLVFYCAELGMAASINYCLLAVANLFLYSIVQHTSFFAFDTFLLLIGMFFAVFFVGRMTDHLSRMAYSDSLTMLPNRYYFQDKLSALLVKARRNRSQLAVYFLDLDQFKHINDTMGHAAGDALLKKVAERMKECLPKKATLSRMGGDEFTLVVSDLKSMDEAKSIAEKIIEAMERSILLHEKEVFISCSIGIVLYPSDGQDAETLMKNADAAMYRAKEQGRNNYQFYAPPNSQDRIERVTMETMLRHAVERKQFIVYYQPRVYAHNEQLACLEALVRWHHPVHGIIQPKDFIPLAEETGLIVQIGEQVLQMACKQLKQWLDRGFPEINISVNLSARQFSQPNLPGVIAKILKEEKLHPSYLELEITESMAMGDINHAVAMLRTLKDMGIKVVIDDFGTGYSSLSYLKRLPIDGLKIDRSFIQNILTDPDDAAIVNVIITLAKTLNLSVTAEGVETVGQHLFLKERHCDEAQGFLFGKPMPKAMFEDWIRHVMSEEEQQKQSS